MIIHPNQPLDNFMVIGPYYDETRPEFYAEPDTCAKCGDEEFDMKRSHEDGKPYCSSCTRTCAICGDWLLTDATVRDAEGAEAHTACAADLIAMADYCDRMEGAA